MSRRPVNRRTIEAVWRMESPRLIATLARLVRDVGLAEELAQDAFVLALEQWPDAASRTTPVRWLTATAKHKASTPSGGNRVSRPSTPSSRPTRLPCGTPTAQPDVAADQPIDDDLLALLFVACHPVLPPPSRAALTLRLLGGLTTEEIARAYPGAVGHDRTADLPREADAVRGPRPVRDARSPRSGPRGSGRCSRCSI